MHHSAGIPALGSASPRGAAGRLVCGRRGRGFVVAYAASRPPRKCRPSLALHRVHAGGRLSVSLTQRTVWADCSDSCCLTSCRCWAGGLSPAVNHGAGKGATGRWKFLSGSLAGESATPVRGVRGRRQRQVQGGRYCGGRGNEGERTGSSRSSHPSPPGRGVTTWYGCVTARARGRHTWAPPLACGRAGRVTAVTTVTGSCSHPLSSGS